MGSKRRSHGKITDSVLKDCYENLKSDLSEEVIDHLWKNNNWLTDEERSQIKKTNDNFKRNELLINILSTR